MVGRALLWDSRSGRGFRPVWRRGALVLIGSLWVLGSLPVAAQQLPRVDVEATIRITPLGEAQLEARYRYPGNVYHAVKQVYASNPYVLFRGLTAENQPGFYIDRKSVKIDFDDPNREMRLRLTIPDLFRYTSDGWRMRVPELLSECKVVTQESAKVILSCASLGRMR